MDTRYFGSNLIASTEIRDDRRRRLSANAHEDTYYSRHKPMDGRALHIASLVATACLGFVTIGSWLQ